MHTDARYGVATEKDPTFGGEAVVLRDRLAGSQVRVLPRYGNNLISFVAGLPGGPLEVMLNPGPEDRTPNPVRFGTPILFPFPNRVRDATYTFEGRRYHLEVTSPEGHHLHGLVRARPWQVVEAKATLTGAYVKSVFDAGAFRDILRQVPSCFTLSVTYTLAGNTVRVQAEAQNTGRRNLPFGFGLHPYFRLPLTAAARPYDCQICVPAARLWRLDHAKMPTGVVEAVPPDLDFRACRRMGDAELDHVFTGLSRAKGLATCRLLDPVAQAELGVRFGPEFPVVVVYAPASRPTVCFEPYTCTTNAINLAAQTANSGLLVLAPGQVWRGTVEFTVMALGA